MTDPGAAARLDAALAGRAQAPRLLDALRRMGLREDEVALVARDNWLRVLRTVLGGNNAVVQNRI